MTHTISVLVENKAGVLARVAGLFSARAFNIDSLAVGETEDPTVSRMTIVVRGDDRTLEQIIKQLNRLVDVIRVRDISKEPFFDRQLMLIRVGLDGKSREKLLKLAQDLGAQVVDAHQDNAIFELAGDQKKMDGMLEAMKPFGIREVVRTGRIALSQKTEVTLKDLKE
ncbi:MAG: acetolactate synthase small subunit [Candidatus Omnitrophica bacterium]|nr:acetolactate synthase small subunit [Candidatus Omnitrophota bacterium]